MSIPGSSLLTLLTLAFLVWDIGFGPPPWMRHWTVTIYPLLALASLRVVWKDFQAFPPGRKWLPLAVGLLPLAILVLPLASWLRGSAFHLAVREVFSLFVIHTLFLMAREGVRLSEILYARKSISPPILLAATFFFLILFGTCLLMVPESTRGSISWLDAAFTATSAVSVTGLTLFDTGKVFTPFGQVVILMLIQLGGLSIMVLTAFFASFFKAETTYRENTYLGDFLGADHFADLLGLARKVVTFVLTIECIGALIIWWNLPPLPEGNSLGDRLFFSLFHAVSAFCNAGFSLLGDNLHDPLLRFRYSIHLVLALLIIFGGLGYIIHFNISDFFRYRWQRLKAVWLRRDYTDHIRKVRLSLNAHLVIFTSGSLLLFGWAFFLLAEWHRPVLQEHPSLWGKSVVAFFGSVTPRTAGFNLVDMTALSLPTIFLTLLLMWVGASPASTGGGIKTSTLAIALLNIWHTLTGREKQYVANREIDPQSVHRAFAIIVLSLLAISLGILVLSLTDSDKSFLAICFESFSAFSTVGLSLGITPAMSEFGKAVLILLMFLGRIGLFSILGGLLARREPPVYGFPRENVLIT